MLHLENDGNARTALDARLRSAVLSRTFPVATYDRTVNERGIAVRRLVLAGEWEVDPDALRPDSTTD
jgi:hypothetical protein